MKKKSVFALMMAMTVIAGISTPATVSQAAGLAQAQDASTVTYRFVSAGEAAYIKQMFDVEFYKAHNPDLVAILGEDENVLFEHFYKCGIFEGRTCNANFDPSAYASAYSDLREIYGGDILYYYMHYLTYGANESRTITTIEACANAGITVTSLVDESVKIDPAVYFFAINNGIKEFKALQTAVNKLEGSSSNGNSGSSEAPVNTVFVRPNNMLGNFWVVKSYPEAYDDARGLELVDTLTITDDAGASKTYYIYKDTNGVAIYNANDSTAEVIYSTEGYSKDSTIDNSTYIGEITAKVDPYPNRWENINSLAGNDSYITRSMTEADKAKLADKTLHINHDSIGDKKENPISASSSAIDSTGRYINSASEGIVASYSTNYYAQKSYADGIYTEGEDWRKFEESDGLSKSEYTVIGTWSDLDEKNDTPYDVSFDIIDNGDSINVVVGISNTETEFAQVSEFEFPVPDESESTSNTPD